MHENGKQIDERWPTARAVAHKLGCTRQQVAALERRGVLLGHDVREKGVKLRRFDPASVRAALEDAAELDQLIDVELVADDDGDEAAPSASASASANANAMALASKALSESRQVAVDARRGQQEAYELIAKPSREFTETIMRALEQREKRIAELEEKLNKFYDEQREARLEEREASYHQARLDRSDSRKDQFFQMAMSNAPIILEQIKRSINGGGGPLAAWMTGLTPAQQEKVVMAIRAVLGDDEEPPHQTAQNGAAS